MDNADPEKLMGSFRPVAVVRRMCSTALMRRSTYATITSAMLAATSILGGCDRPVSDAEQLRALRAETQTLMRDYPPEQPSKWKSVPKDQWPTAISSLHPEAVTVYVWGVEIMTKPSSDGGYGYEVPRNKADSRCQQLVTRNQAKVYSGMARADGSFPPRVDARRRAGRIGGFR